MIYIYIYITFPLQPRIGQLACEPTREPTPYERKTYKEPTVIEAPCTCMHLQWGEYLDNQNGGLYARFGPQRACGPKESRGASGEVVLKDAFGEADEIQAGEEPPLGVRGPARAKVSRLHWAWPCGARSANNGHRKT